jgi:hypothetical protein
MSNPNTDSVTRPSVRRLVRPFVVIEPYQYDGDLALGVWDELLQRYRLGDGDCYNADELEQSWRGEYTLLTWCELEERLRGPNTPDQRTAEKL